MKRKLLIIVIIVIVFALGIFGLVACEAPADCGPVWDSLSVESYDDLIIMFTNESLYPVNTSDMLDITVYSDPLCHGPGNLYARRDVVEEKPELESVSWQYYASNGVRVNVTVSEDGYFGHIREFNHINDDIILENIAVKQGTSDGLGMSVVIYGDLSIVLSAGDDTIDKVVTATQLEQYNFAINEHLMTFVRPL